MGTHKIIISGDIFRPGHSNECGTQNNNIKILHHLFSYSIYKACGIMPSLLLHSPTAMNVEQYYAQCDSRNFLEHWAKLYDNVTDLAPLATLYAPYFNNSIFIFFEMPPYLEQLLRAHGVPYIDFRIHPIRFLDDLLLAARSSSPDVQAALHGFSMGEDNAYLGAQACKAIATQMPLSVPIEKNSLLVAGQCTYDATQITNGKLFDIKQAVQAIDRVCSAHGQVLLKPHPAEAAYPLIEYLSRALFKTTMIKDNSYLLLAHDNLSSLLTVNSSLAYEAKYFNKKVHLLSNKKYEVAYLNGPFKNDTYASLDHVFLTPDFWRVILRPFFSVSPKDNTSLHFKPNRLRTIWNCFWDYNKIDTDIFINKWSLQNPPCVAICPNGPQPSLWSKLQTLISTTVPWATKSRRGGL